MSYATGSGCSALAPVVTGSYPLSNVYTSGSSSVITMSGTATASIMTITPEHQGAIVIAAEDGDIYRGKSVKGNGIFHRLEKLERMLGILSRQRSLEDAYPPLRQTGEEYELACNRAIASIIEAAATELSGLRDRYESEAKQARVYVELSRE